MKTFELPNHTLEYDDDDHVYIVDGLIVPSVTQVLGKRFGGKYDRVDKETLNRAAKRGTRIHEAIETFVNHGLSDQSKEVHNFHFLCVKYGVTPVETESPIVIEWYGTPVAAGRFDLLVEKDGVYGLADIKTTSQLDKEYLADRKSVV